MYHSDAIGPRSSRCFGTPDGGYDVIVVKWGEIRHESLLPDPSENFPRNGEVFVVANGGKLFVEFLCNGRALCMDFALE